MKIELTLQELEGILRGLASTSEEWRKRPWGPHCHQGVSKLMKAFIRAKAQEWQHQRHGESRDVEALQAG